MSNLFNLNISSISKYQFPISYLLFGTFIITILIHLSKCFTL